MGEIMNREIEFRAKRKDNDEWVYGFYYCHKGLNEHYILPIDTTKFYNGIPIVKNFIEVKEETLGQYTGLKDKNGTKIFEGDILKQAPYMCDENPCVVCYDTEVGSGIGFYLYTYCDRQVLSDEWEDFEVIGNIYDNPELLQQTE